MFGLFKKTQKSLDLHMPAMGTLVGLEAVPDVVFSQKMVGDGFAFIPKEGTISSPVSGTVIQIFPTNHAIGIKTAEGVEVLIHIGIDTVQLKGLGFRRLTEQGATVSIGTPLIEVDLAVLEENNKPIITPVIITNMDVADKLTMEIHPQDQVLSAGTKAMTVTLK